MMMNEALMLDNQSVDGETLSLIEAASKLGIGVFTSVPLMQRRLLNDKMVPKFGNIDSVAVRCLQFIRSAGVTAPLVGHKKMDHVQENIQVAKIPPISEQEFKEMIAKLARTK
jgi:aryl-alcohol dehydrogenase-like predicted oxidoreductase